MEEQKPGTGTEPKSALPDCNLRFEVFKLEYENLAEGYRHTYQTIWQAGSVFMSVSAALLAFGSGGTAGKMVTVIQWIWPLPFFFWWLGIFTPMDRYGKLRLRRLKELEKMTQDNPELWGHGMCHFSTVESSSPGKKRQKLVLFKKLHVGWMVDIFGIIIALAWSYSNLGLLLKCIGL